MKTNRRQALTDIGSLLVCAMGGEVYADTYPSRTIRVIVPRAPGGGSDIIARLLSQGMQQKSGQSFIVENRPDASAVVGAVQVANATPDGYTVFLSDNAFYQNPAVMRKLPYDTLKDFSSVTMLAQGPVILVTHPSVPERNTTQLTPRKYRTMMLEEDSSDDSRAATASPDKLSDGITTLSGSASDDLRDLHCF